MKKNVFVFMIFLGCATMPVMADYTIGDFIAPKGADGTNGINGTNGTDACPPLISSNTKNAQGCFVVKQKSQVRSNGVCQPSGEWSIIDTVCDCRPTETRTPCGHGTEEVCGTAGRAGYKIVTTQCDGSGSTTSYIYDNNCGITVASTTDVYQDNDTTKPVTHKRVTFKNTCTNETLSTTADVPVGCTPTYTQKYINKETNGSFTYNNDSRGENTVGARVTVSGCGNDNSFDTYDGNDGTSFNYKGSVANCSALNSVSNPSQNDAYIVNGDGNGKLCIYNGSSWPTCPSGCAEFTGPAGASNCTGFETSTTAVKNTLRTYSGPSDSTTSGGVTFYATRGKTVLTHKMCNTSLNDTVDNENDPCVPIIAPNGVTCNGTYMECKRGDNSTTYNVCEATTGTTFSSALSNKEDAVCVGTNANSSSVEREKTVSYAAPTGSGSYGTYSWKTAVGKVVNKSVKCDNSETTISSTPDKCEEIVKPNGVCTASGKVYYKCTQQNNGTVYNLCADGNSVLGAAQSAAETAVAAVDPCAVNPTSNTIIKTTSTTTYSRGTKTDGVYSAIGKKTVTKTACNGDAYTTDEQDDCIEVAKPSGKCTAATSAYLRCYNAQASSDKTYYVCQDLGTGNNSLANKVDGKIDASYLTTNGYLTSDSNLNAGKLTGVIDANRLPSTVVTASTLGSAVSDAINTEITNGAAGAFKDFVTNDTLTSAVSTEVGSAISEKTVTFGNLQITLDEALELVGKAAGTCTRTSSGGDSEDAVSCSNGALGSVSTTGKNPGN